jgi:hypothetical protein
MQQKLYAILTVSNAEQDILLGDIWGKNQWTMWVLLMGKNKG